MVNEVMWPLKLGIQDANTKRPNIKAIKSVNDVSFISNWLSAQCDDSECVNTECVEVASGKSERVASTFEVGVEIVKGIESKIEIETHSKQ